MREIGLQELFGFEVPWQVAQGSQAAARQPRAAAAPSASPASAGPDGTEPGCGPAAPGRGFECVFDVGKHERSTLHADWAKHQDYLSHLQNTTGFLVPQPALKRAMEEADIPGAAGGRALAMRGPAAKKALQRAAEGQ